MAALQFVALPPNITTCDDKGVSRMRREWEPEELIDCWTLVDDDWELVAKKRGPRGWGSRCC